MRDDSAFALIRAKVVNNEGCKWSPIIFMLVVHVALLCHGILMHFPNFDEIAHLPAGVSHWEFARFDLYRVNPPLVRLVAAFPAWLSGEKYNWSLYTASTVNRAEFDIGIAKLKRDRLNIHKSFILPRLCCVAFSLLGAVLLTYWIAQVFGWLPANLACAYWCFSPDILAHGQSITPDVPAVSAGLVVSFLFWKYAHAPSYMLAYCSGIGLGIALLTKLTWITGVIVFPSAVVLCYVLFGKSLSARAFRPRIMDLSLMFAAAWFVLNLGYLFEGTGTLLKDLPFCSEMFGGPGSQPNQPGNRFRNEWLGTLPIPVPKNFLLGIDYLKHEVEVGKWSFMMGKWKYGSWLFYYSITILLKTPISCLIAALLGGIMLIGRRRPGGTMLVFVGLPALAVFAAVSLQGGFSHHHRYVLPIYPALFTLAAGLGSSRWVGLLRLRQVTSVVACVLMIGASASVAPHFLGYFNRLAGGPENGWRILGSSNVDWGQDLLLVNDWIQSHPHARPLAIDLDYLGMNAELFGVEPIWPEYYKSERPSVIRPGWYIISVKRLYNIPGKPGLGYFRDREPWDRIGYSFRVYYIGSTQVMIPRSEKSSRMN